MNMSEQSKEAAEIKKIPAELLEYLPRRRWQMTVAALIALAVVLSVFLVLTIKQNIRNARLGAELNRYESLWENKGISNYEYAIEARNDNGRSKVAVRVEDGAAISEGLANPFTSEIYGVPTDIDSFDTVPDLFSIAETLAIPPKSPLPLATFSGVLACIPTTFLISGSCTGILNWKPN